MGASSTSFKKGVSGNPGGKARSETFREIRELARKHCPEAVQFWINTLNDEGETWERRNSSAHAIVDRGIGKAVQAVTGEDGEALRIEVVERRIVRAAA